MTNIDKLLFEGIAEQDLSKIRKALISGADINAICDISDWDQEISGFGVSSFKGYRVIHFAAVKGTPKIIAHLIRQGVNLDLLTAGGGNVVHVATWRGPLENLQVLLPKISSQQLNKKNKWGGTPLHEAAKFNAPDKVLALLEAGADFSEEDNSKRTALGLALDLNKGSQYRTYANVIKIISEWEKDKAKNGYVNENLFKVLDKKLSSNNAVDIFKWLAEQSVTWENIIHYARYYYDRDKERIINHLLKKRDDVDAEIYFEATNNAMKALFPTQSFSIIPNPMGIIEEVSEGKATFKKRWYVLAVFDGIGSKFAEDGNYWEITIKAPGSRTFTSDIDTVLSVVRKGELPDYLGKNKDYAVRIKTAVVKYFNQISGKIIGLSSGTSRDSNVYSDVVLEKDLNRFRLDIVSKFPTEPRLFSFILLDSPQGMWKLYYIDKGLKKEEISIENVRGLTKALKNDNTMEIKKILKEYQARTYPQYVNYRKFPGHPSYDGEIFSDYLPAENYKKFYFVQKSKKHQLEYAASLVSLGDFLEKDGWTQFVDETLSRLKEDSLLKNALVPRDFLTISGLTNRCIEFQKNALKLEEERFPKSKDKESCSMNSLYAKHLLRIEDLNDVIIKGDNEINKLSLKIKEVQNQIDGGGSAMRIIALNTNKEELKRDLKNILKTQADNYNEKQKILIQVDLFANGIYINRSAQIHVVDGMQLGANTSLLSKHVIICSMLQQIGFYLLHSRDQRKNLKDMGITEADIAYKNAKYFERVSHLIFKEKENISLFDDFQCQKEAKLFPYNNLQLTKNEHNILALFTNQLLPIKNFQINEKEKLAKAKETVFEIVRRLLDEKDMKEDAISDYLQKDLPKVLLSITQKMIVCGYKEKLKKKGEIWGFFKGAPSNDMQKNWSEDDLSICPSLKSKL